MRERIRLRVRNIEIGFDGLRWFVGSYVELATSDLKIANTS
jgi:hypothetical protein